MTNPTQLYKVLPGGQTCKKVNPHLQFPDGPLNILWSKFERNNPILPLTEPMEEGKEFIGVEVWQYLFEDNWLTEESEQSYKKYTNFDSYANAHLFTGYKNRLAIKPIQPIKEEKEVPKDKEVMILDVDHPNSCKVRVIGRGRTFSTVMGLEDGQKPFDVMSNRLTPLEAVDANKEGMSFDTYKQIEEAVNEKFGSPYLSKDTLRLIYAGANFGAQWQQSQSIDGNEVTKWKTLYEEQEAIIEPLQDKVILLEAELGASIEGIVILLNDRIAQLQEMKGLSKRETELPINELEYMLSKFKEYNNGK